MDLTTISTVLMLESRNMSNFKNNPIIALYNEAANTFADFPDNSSM